MKRKLCKPTAPPRDRKRRIVICDDGKVLPEEGRVLRMTPNMRAHLRDGSITVEDPPERKPAQEPDAGSDAPGETQAADATAPSAAGEDQPKPDAGEKPKRGRKPSALPGDGGDQ